MLNKELLMVGKPHDSSSVVMTIGRLRTPGWADKFGWSAYEEYGSISKTPYWGDASLYSLVCFETFSDMSIKTVAGFNSSIPVELTIEINNNHFTIPKGVTNFGAEGDVLGIFNTEGKQVTVTFNPPPTVTTNHYETSTEKSVDAQQGIIDDGKCESIGERYYTVSGIKSISSVTGQERRHIRDLLCRRNCRLFQQNCEFKCSCRNKSTSDSFGNPYKRASTESALDTHTVQPKRHQLIIDIADQEVFVEIEIAL